MSMIQLRNEVLTHIAARKIDRWIACETYYSDDLIRGIRHCVRSPSDLVTLDHPLRVHQKLPRELMAEGDRCTRGDPASEARTRVHLQRIGPELIGGVNAAENPKAMRRQRNRLGY
jgi:hypothetical protein